jgi:RimJ/RimL family protein N-acetyltransferase
VNLRPSASGHNLALRSEWAFCALGVERLELYVEPDNAASRSVARKAGFLEGLLRKHGRRGTECHDMILCSKLPSVAE